MTITMTDLDQKVLALQTYFKTLGKVMVAFSGGADSAFLLYWAKASLPAKNVLAVVADSVTFPPQERQDALAFLSNFDVPYHVLYVDELNNPDFVKNDKNRCYFCRQGLFEGLQKLGAEMGYEHIVEGSNKDDEKDYRPGKKAILELGIKSPLKEVGFTKAEIREVSQKVGLPTWDRPSMACLSSRIPYGQSITMEKVERIATLEKYIWSLGIRQVRVRDHQNLARIEIPAESFDRLITAGFNTQLFKELGFNYVTLDLEGYRTGSMNEVLHKDEKK